MQALNLYSFLDKKEYVMRTHQDMELAQQQADQILAKKANQHVFHFDMERGGVLNHLDITKINAYQYRIREEQIFNDGEQVENKKRVNTEIASAEELEKMLDNLFKAMPELKKNIDLNSHEISVCDLIEKAQINFQSITDVSDQAEAMKFKKFMAFDDPANEKIFNNFISKNIKNKMQFPFMGNVAATEVEKYFNESETIFKRNSTSGSFELREFETENHQKAYILKENIDQFGLKRTSYSVFNSIEAVQNIAFPIMVKVHGNKLANECERDLNKFVNQKFAENSFLKLMKNNLEDSVKHELTQSPNKVHTVSDQKSVSEMPLNEIYSKENFQKELVTQQKGDLQEQKKRHDLDVIKEKLHEDDVTSLASEAKAEPNLMDSFGMDSVPYGTLEPSDFLKTKIPANFHFKIDESYVLAESKGATPESEALLKNKSFHSFNLDSKRTIYGMAKSVLHALPKILADTGVVFYKGIQDAMLGKQMTHQEKYKFADLKPEQKLQEENTAKQEFKQNQKEQFHL